MVTEKWIDAFSRSIDKPRMEFCEDQKSERLFTFVQYKDSVMRDVAQAPCRRRPNTGQAQSVITCWDPCFAPSLFPRLGVAEHALVTTVDTAMFATFTVQPVWQQWN